MNQDTKFDFAKAVSEIEEINQWFQNEDVDLDEGLAKFRRGLELIKKCRTRLKQVENEFTQIKKEFNVEDKSSKDTVSNPQISQDKKNKTPEDVPF